MIGGGFVKYVKPSKIKVRRSKDFEKRQFYLDMLYIYRNWSPRMRKAFGVTKKHVKSVLKKYEKYK